MGMTKYIKGKLKKLIRSFNDDYGWEVTSDTKQILSVVSQPKSHLCTLNESFGDEDTWLQVTFGTGYPFTNEVSFNIATLNDDFEETNVLAYNISFEEFEKLIETYKIAKKIVEDNKDEKDR